ncbi:MAG: hypothetical protein R3275_02850 [Saprospiraceae bacterium]|nr:hypothetical protein [Saprospiraceae bacterium]
MKLKIFKSSLLLGALLLFVLSLYAGSPFSKEYSKVIIKEFPLSEDQSVMLNNQYGLVNVESWSQDMVKIKIEIVVDAGSETDAEEVYKKIRFAFEESNEGVSCTTRIEEGSTGFWGWWNGNDDINYSINYDVKMPSESHLAVSNKYGDCTVNNLQRSADFNIKYGNLHTYGDMENINLSLGYGKARIESAVQFDGSLEYCTFKSGSIEKCELNSKYSNIFIEDAGELVCNTKYDDYNLGMIGTLRNKGKYDDFHIEEVSDIGMQTMYADLEINRLHHFADLRFQYGEVAIHGLSDAFKRVALEGSYADFKINTSEVNNFRLEFDGQYSDLDCKRDLAGREEEKDGTSYRLAGYVEAPDGGGDIIARVTYGNVKIK